MPPSQTRWLALAKTGGYPKSCQPSLLQRTVPSRRDPALRGPRLAIGVVRCLRDQTPVWKGAPSEFPPQLFLLRATLLWTRLPLGKGTQRWTRPH